jgi:pimeloyl-ACP methyl ester carboxylesterase
VAPAAASAIEETGSGATIHWKSCDPAPSNKGSARPPDVECGTVEVLVDWSNPKGEKIKIAVARRRATDPAARIGMLVMDPGGPGIAGAQQVRTLPDLGFSAEVYRRYDVVGFDPRGVGDSHPVLCSATAVPPRGDTTTKEGFAERVSYNRAYRATCREHTGKLYDFVDTASVAQDMDAIRSALGEPKLNYYGISYGTLMGQQYAERFPQRVGRFVLDSNMDHSEPTARDFLDSEARAAQSIFGEYVEWCARTAACALHGSDVRAVHRELLARAGRGELVEPGGTGDAATITPLLYLAIVNGGSYDPDWYDLAQTMKDLRDAATDPAAATRAGELLRTVTEAAD